MKNCESAERVGGVCDFVRLVCAVCRSDLVNGKGGQAFYKLMADGKDSESRTAAEILKKLLDCKPLFFPYIGGKQGRFSEFGDSPYKHIDMESRIRV